MSWEEYVNGTLMESGTMTGALICTMDGTVCAASADFGLKEYEAEINNEDGSSSMQVVNEAANLAAFVASGKTGPQGVRVNGVKYLITKPLDDSFNGASCQIIKGWLGQKGKQGLAVVTTHTLIIVAICDNNQAAQQTPAAARTCGFLSDYLMKLSPDM